MINFTDNDLKQNVYEKSTNKNNLINFNSRHNNRIKTETITGFYLRANKIISPLFLYDKKK